MNDHMEYPKFFELIRIVAIIGAALGCIAGVVSFFGAFSLFSYSAGAGFMGLAGGVGTIIGSLAMLGVTYAFLALVKANIDTRNAIVKQAQNK